MKVSEFKMTAMVRVDDQSACTNVSALKYSFTCFPEFPVPEHGHDDQQVPDNIHHDGRDENAGQHGHHPGKRLVVLTRGAFPSCRRGVPGPQGPFHHDGLIVLQGHQLRKVPRVDESHRVVVAGSWSIQHNARLLHRVYRENARVTARKAPEQRVL